jgi:hypothetical protein
MAPGESVSFEWRVYPVGVGEAGVQVVNINGHFRFDPTSRDSRIDLSLVGERFQSNLLQLPVEASDGPKMRTIEQTFIEMK